MTVRLTAFLEFDNLASARDAFAQLLARAQQARVVSSPTGLIQSFARVDDGALQTHSDGQPAMFHMDRFGIARRGEYVKPSGYPLWVQPTGAQDSYPMLDALGQPTRVEYNGRNYQNSAGTVNSWAPGVFGWTDIGAAGSP
jgi:hypothetical protein